MCEDPLQDEQLAIVEGLIGDMVAAMGDVEDTLLYEQLAAELGQAIERGAAGASILNAELLVADGWLPDDGTP